MTWRYEQSTGQLSLDGAVIGVGYSGHGAGLDNPALEGDRGVGPIPCGTWTVGDPKDPPDHLGPFAMPLTPDEATDTLGRSGFFIHGDNPAMDHTASDGCIILGRVIRTQIAASADRQLEVVA